MSSLRITDNDLMLFKYLFECDFLTREQVRGLLWSHLNEDHVNRRLSRLTKEGYVKKFPDPRFNRKTVIAGDENALYYLRLRDIKNRLKNLSRGNSKLCYIDPDFYNVRDKLDLRQFDHDRMLNGIRLTFENLGVDYWVPHLYLYRMKPAKRIPDAIFVRWNYVYAFELENTLKQRYRYKDIFKKYARMVFGGKGIDFEKMPSVYNECSSLRKILYVATSDSIYKSLQDKINTQFISYSTSAYRGFFVANLNDIINGNYKFHNESLKKYITLDKD